MATKKVMIEEISKDLFFINLNSPLIRMIEFGYILHYNLIESELIEDNSWFDFIFGVNLKIVDSYEDVLLLNQSEVKNLLKNNIKQNSVFLPHTQYIFYCWNCSFLYCFDFPINSTNCSNSILLLISPKL